MVVPCVNRSTAAAPTAAAGSDSSLQIEITPPEPPRPYRAPEGRGPVAGTDETKLREQDEKTQRKAVPIGRPRRHTPQE